MLGSVAMWSLRMAQARQDLRDVRADVRLYLFISAGAFALGLLIGFLGLNVLP